MLKFAEIVTIGADAGSLLQATCCACWGCCSVWEAVGAARAGQVFDSAAAPEGLLS